ncbi:Uncharacterised protein [Bordetella pertussis]|nr:Uncharacterised protein [Bordetella pertussis]CPP94510.1 Uncharacterised protein [Bordetella pertussis]
MGAENAQTAHQCAGVLALLARLRYARQQADFLADRPQHQRQGFALGAQAVEHAHRARRVAGQHGVAQPEDVVARHVEHGALDVLGGQLAFRIKQPQLLDFLVGRQQVALDLVGHPLQRGGVGALVLAPQAHANPCRQAAALDVGDVGHDAAARQRLGPFAFARGLVQAGQGHDHERVGVGLVARLVGQPGQHLAAALAGLAGRDFQFQQAPVAEQRDALRGGRHRAPVAARVHDHGGAVGVAGRARRRADGVGGLGDQQRLVARYRVQRRQPAPRACEVAGQGVAVQGRSHRQGVSMPG